MPNKKFTSPDKKEILSIASKLQYDTHIHPFFNKFSILTGTGFQFGPFYFKSFQI